MVLDMNIPVEINGNTTYAHDVQGDGNCLFRAICVSLGINDDIYHLPLRNVIVDQVIHNRRHFGRYMQTHDFDPYVERMRRNREWGSTIEMQAFAQILKCDLLSYRRLENSSITPNPEAYFYECETRNTRQVGILYVNNNHFMSIPSLTLGKEELQSHLLQLLQPYYATPNNKTNVNLNRLQGAIY